MPNMKLSYILITLVACFSLSAVELLNQENQAKWKFPNKETVIGAEGVSIDFQEKATVNCSRLDVAQNDDCLLAITCRLSKGAKMFFYVENHTGKNWQNKAVNVVGNDQFRTHYIHFKFTKPVQGNTYSAMRLTGPGKLDIKSLIFIKDKDMNGKIINADFSEGAFGWNIEKNASIVKNKQGNNVLELWAQKPGDAARVVTGPVAIQALKNYRLSYSVTALTGFGKSSIEHDLRMYPMDKRNEALAGTERWQVALDGRTQVKHLDFQVPARHQEITFALEARGPARVQFSNFKLELIEPKQAAAELLLDPQFAYRDGVFSTNGAKAITGKVAFNVKDAVAEISLLDGEKELLKKRCTAADASFTLPVPASGSAYTLNMTVSNGAGKTLLTEKRSISNHKPNPVEVTFRDDGITLLNGKPFFHIGNWWYTNRGDRDEDLEFLKEAGFNVILLPRDKDHPDRFTLLDQISKHGLYAELELPHRYPETAKTPQAKSAFKRKWANLIKKYLQHPALFAYFGPDEAMLAGFQIETMEEFYHLCRDNDPYHPFWYNEAPVGQVSDLKAYAKDTCDVYGVDIYPIGAPHGTDLGDRSMTVVGKHTDRCMQAVEFRKPVWMIVQGFSWIHMRKPARFKPVSEVPNAQYPTWEQTRFMAYNAILHGATGLQYHYLGYTVHVPDDFWKGIRRTTLELKYLTPALTARTTKNPAMKCDQAKVNMMVKNLDGKNYYFLANESPDAITARFTGFPEKQLNVLYEDKPIAVNGGAFALELEPYAVRVLSEVPFADKDAIWQKATYRPYSQKIKDDVRK